MYVCLYVLLESHEAEASGDHMDQNVRNLEKIRKIGATPAITLTASIGKRNRSV